MKCKECEEKIWTLPELSEREHQQVMTHVKECSVCADELAKVERMATFMHKADTVLIHPENAARLTSKVMQSLHQPAVKSSRTVLILEYMLRVTSMVLIIFFITEQLPVAKITKQLSYSRTVELNLSNFFNAYRNERKTKTVSLYAQYEKIKQTKGYEIN
ncbi:MAG: anti-sigma factor family protein [Flammeovirgaceae bacterium]